MSATTLSQPFSALSDERRARVAASNRRRAAERLAATLPPPALNWGRAPEISRPKPVHAPLRPMQAADAAQRIIARAAGWSNNLAIRLHCQRIGSAAATEGVPLSPMLHTAALIARATRRKVSP